MPYRRRSRQQPQHRQRRQGQRSSSVSRRYVHGTERASSSSQSQRYSSHHRGGVSRRPSRIGHTYWQEEVEERMTEAGELSPEASHELSMERGQASSRRSRRTPRV